MELILLCMFVYGLLKGKDDRSSKKGRNKARERRNRERRRREKYWEDANWWASNR